MLGYTHHTEHCLNDASRDRVTQLAESLAAYEQALVKGSDPLAAPVIERCSHTEDLVEIERVAQEIRNEFAHVIICGAGGSGLSGQVLANLKLYAANPRLYVLDNMDPSAMEALMQQCDLSKTLVVAISKSGSTVETLGQLYAFFLHMFALFPKNTSRHFMVITQPSDSPMRRFAAEKNIRILEHPKEIGGRFSLLTVVGLLSAALVGLDIRALRAGAQTVMAKLGKEMHPARLGAALQYYYVEQGHNMSVMLPYCERLSGFSAWYRQVWAESLGKHGKGSTPIRAVGTTDQHSQLQLYLDGPADKFFTLIFHERAGTGPKIMAPNWPELDYLQGKTTGDVMDAEQYATLETLVACRRPVRLIRLVSLDEYSLGALIGHFMLELFFMAHLLGVNAFDQPAVEDGKQRARAYLRGGSA